MQPFVQSLKAAAPVRPALQRTVPEAMSTPAQMPAGHLNAGGANAIVGIVDFGCDFAHNNLRVLGSKMGGARIQADIPRLVALYRQGRLKLDELISGRYPLARINDAIAWARSGEALRNVIVFG